MFAKIIAAAFFLLLQVQDIPWTPGEALISMDNEKTLDYTKKRALAEAKADAIRRATGEEVKSTRVVENSALTFDLTQAFTNGMVVATEIEENRAEPITVGKESLLMWRVKLRAKVAKRPVRHDPTFRVDLKLDKSTLHPEEEITIQARAASDAYLHVFDIDSEGAVTVLIPNKFHVNNFVKKGETLEFPSPDDRRNGIRLKAALPGNLPETIETVVVVATRQPIDLIGTDFKEAFRMYPPNETGAFESLVQKLWNLGDADWVQEMESYRITKR